MKIFVKNQFGSEEKAPSEINNGIRELENHILLQKNNTMEDYYCEIEGELASYIEKIQKDGINFYYQMSKTEKYEFLHMICIQYFRTRALDILVKINRSSGKLETVIPDDGNPHCIA